MRGAQEKEGGRKVRQEADRLTSLAAIKGGFLRKVAGGKNNSAHNPTKPSKLVILKDTISADTSWPSFKGGETKKGKFEKDADKTRVYAVI